MRFSSVSDFIASGFKPRVVIVGTGPAGLSLALRLSERKVTCLMIEAGGYDYSGESQDFYRGDVVGDRYHELDHARLRQFGGTSGHWGGWCRTLDAADFEARPAVPHSGWPIRKQDLDPYAPAAGDILQMRRVDADRSLTPDVDQVDVVISPAVRFGNVYRKTVEVSKTIGLLLNTSLRELMPGNDRIESIVVVDASSQPHTLRVERVCLCTGGIENSRVLLWSNRRHNGGVVRQASTLGRYWMEHPVFTVGETVLFNGAVLRMGRMKFYAPSLSAKASHAIGGAHVWIESEGSSRVDRLAREVMCVAPSLFGRLFELAGKDLSCAQTVHIEWEQLPRADNRVELGGELDAHGVPRATLLWTKSVADRRTARTAVQLFGEMLIRKDLGRLHIHDWLLNDGPYPEVGQLAGWHHMGGTRMSDSPTAGIVDRDCRVFGMSNLYIGGSSVFATGGHANPTFTIVQLALRLGDHLATVLRGLT